MPKGQLSSLNPVEIALLILSAYFHDQGMVLEKEELDKLNSDPKFKIFKENWAIDHPNLNEIQHQSIDKNLSIDEQKKCRHIEQELLDAMLTDYIRHDHHLRSAYYVKSKYSHDSTWEVAGVNLAPYVAMLCESHGLPAYDLIPRNGFNYDESIGQYKINLSFLGLVLRLADILDFDHDRAPDSLYKTIHFTNDVSLAEWEKHRSVIGWEISPNNIRFSMQCRLPHYQKAALDFMDLIEIGRAHV